MTERYVAYIRVSTDKQGISGLGQEGQRMEVQRFIAARNAELVCEFSEVESAKNGSDRPKLQAAIDACRLHRASLLIAKLDRLSRSAVFLHNLRDSGVQFTCIDMPDASQLVLGIMINVAEDERDRISKRTKIALAALKARGCQLGGLRANNRPPDNDARARSIATRTAEAANNAQLYASTIREIQDAGATTLKQIATALEDRKIPTPKGKYVWHPAQVSRLMKLIGPRPAS